MSDFDKEAERERLREQYEQEEDDRETTARMSELLLKGATMTNAHCGECGDPIFRYEGQEFCPTCQQVVADADQTGAAQPQNGDEAAADSEEAAESSDGATAAAESPATPEEGESATPEAPTVTDANEAATPAEGSADAAESAGADERSVTEETPERSDLPERRERARVPDRDRHSPEPPRRPDPPARRDSPEDATAAAADDLTAARDSLQRTLLRFAREAEAAEDPRRAKEHLEAANEAADALTSVSEIR